MDNCLLIFTDLDGSLLDHHDYSHAVADALLAELEALQIPVIPATSKTLPEMLALRVELNNRHPFIIENGAGVLIPAGYFPVQPDDCQFNDGYWVKAFTRPRAHWQSLLANLDGEYGGSYTSFEQAGVEGIMQMTGLDRETASLAAQRRYGEPLAWQGSEEDRQVFITRLQSLGATVLQGGRFLHVSGECNKGTALAWLTAQYRAALPGQALTTLAIGDSDNDIAMLEAADIALVIRSPVNEPPSLSRQQKTLRSTLPGPAGWVEGVRRVLGSAPGYNCPQI